MRDALTLVVNEIIQDLISGTADLAIHRLQQLPVAELSHEARRMLLAASLSRLDTGTLSDTTDLVKFAASIAEEQECFKYPALLLERLKSQALSPDWQALIAGAGNSSADAVAAVLLRDNTDGMEHLAKSLPTHPGRLVLLALLRAATDPLPAMDELARALLAINGVTPTQVEIWSLWGLKFAEKFPASAIKQLLTAKGAVLDSALSAIPHINRGVKVPVEEILDVCSERVSEASAACLAHFADHPSAPLHIDVFIDTVLNLRQFLLLRPLATCKNAQVAGRVRKKAARVIQVYLGSAPSVEVIDSVDFVFDEHGDDFRLMLIDLLANESIQLVCAVVRVLLKRGNEADIVSQVLRRALASPVGSDRAELLSSLPPIPACATPGNLNLLNEALHDDDLQPRSVATTLLCSILPFNPLFTIPAAKLLFAQTLTAARQGSSCDARIFLIFITGSIGALKSQSPVFLKELVGGGSLDLPELLIAATTLLDSAGSVAVESLLPPLVHSVGTSLDSPSLRSPGLHLLLEMLRVTGATGRILELSPHFPALIYSLPGDLDIRMSILGYLGFPAQKKIKPVVAQIGSLFWTIQQKTASVDRIVDRTVWTALLEFAATEAAAAQVGDLTAALIGVAEATHIADRNSLLVDSIAVLAQFGNELASLQGIGKLLLMLPSLSDQLLASSLLAIIQTAPELNLGYLDLIKGLAQHSQFLGDDMRKLLCHLLVCSESMVPPVCASLAALAPLLRGCEAEVVPFLITALHQGGVARDKAGHALCELAQRCDCSGHVAKIVRSLLPLMSIDSCAAALAALKAKHALQFIAIFGDIAIPQRNIHETAPRLREEIQEIQPLTELQIDSIIAALQRGNLQPLFSLSPQRSLRLCAALPLAPRLLPVAALAIVDCMDSRQKSVFADFVSSELRAGGGRAARVLDFAEFLEKVGKPLPLDLNAAAEAAGSNGRHALSTRWGRNVFSAELENLDCYYNRVFQPMIQIQSPPVLKLDESTVSLKVDKEQLLQLVVKERRSLAFDVFSPSILSPPLSAVQSKLGLLQLMEDVANCKVQPWLAPDRSDDLIDSWAFLRLRNIAIDARRDLNNWLQLVKQGRHDGDLELSNAILADLQRRLHAQEPAVTFEQYRNMFTLGNEVEAVQGLQEMLVNNLGDMESKVLMKLGRWSGDIAILRKATMIRPNEYKPWLLLATATQSTAKSLFTLAEKKPFLLDSLHALTRVLTLCPATYVFQVVLTVVTIWFDVCGEDVEIDMEIESCLDSTPPHHWLLVLPQIVGRLRTNSQALRTSIFRFLSKLILLFPEALIPHLLAASRSSVESVHRAASRLLSAASDRHSVLVEQYRLLTEQLLRTSELWIERWAQGLDEAYSLLYIERDIPAMLKVLAPLHEMIQRTPTNLRETTFVQAFGRDLQEAQRWTRRYLETGNRADIDQAWRVYYKVSQRVSKQVQSLSHLELQYVSPELLAMRDLAVAVPGTFSPGSPVITIKSISPEVRVMHSKQKPRMLHVTGSDGRQYRFLLKGHEDLKQDERVMQLFSLFNALLMQKRSRMADIDHLSIQTYAIIPLSNNAGLIEWVPGCDTLHSLIKRFREAKGEHVGSEYSALRAAHPKYDDLPILQKVEIFTSTMQRSDGSDLARVLLLQSEDSADYLKRQHVMSCSLAVMSIMGYVLGLGDRHPSNLMISRSTGKIIHIDFGDCFEVASRRPKFPERVPFRLTRMLVNCLGNSEEDFSETCQFVLSLLRKQQSVIETMFEAFVNDPLITWQLVLPGKQVTAQAMSRDTPQLSDCESESSDAECSESSDGSNQNSLVLLKIARQRELANALGPEGVLAQPEVLVNQANEVLARIKAKLSGTDFSANPLSVKDQVARLIEEATSPANLCQSYVGWCPFW